MMIFLSHILLSLSPQKFGLVWIFHLVTVMPNILCPLSYLHLRNGEWVEEEWATWSSLDSRRRKQLGNRASEVSWGSSNVSEVWVWLWPPASWSLIVAHHIQWELVSSTLPLTYTRDIARFLFVYTVKRNRKKHPAVHDTVTSHKTCVCFHLMKN